MPDRSMKVVTGDCRGDGHAVVGYGRGRAPHLLEAGMNGDLEAWEEGVLLACDVLLSDVELDRLYVVGGPPPLALEQVLRPLGTDLRPPGHLHRLRLLGQGYRLALDGDREVLRWVEAVLGHPDLSLGRADLLGPHGFPLHVQDLGAGLEPGPLPEGWLEQVDKDALAGVCRMPDEPQPVWVLLQELGEDPPED